MAAATTKKFANVQLERRSGDREKRRRRLRGETTLKLRLVRGAVVLARALTFGLRHAVQNTPEEHLQMGRLHIQSYWETTRDASARRHAHKHRNGQE